MFTYCKEQPCGAKRKASAYSFDYYLRVAMGLTFTFIILIMIIIINKLWILFDICRTPPHCRLFCTQVCTRLFFRILSQVNVKLQPNEKSNIAWIRFPLSFCLMQKSYMCNTGGDWSVCMGKC